MNLAELSKMDVKDLQKIDYSKLLSDIRKKPDVIFLILIPAITLMFSVNYYMQRKNSIRDLQNKIVLLEQKIQTIDSYNEITEGLIEYVKKIPDPISDNELISQVNDYAMIRNVQIESFHPSKKKESKLYNLSSFVLNVSADEYKDIWLFINDIEESYYSIRVDHFTGTQGSRMANYRRGRRQTTQDSSPISVRLEIALVNIVKE